MAAEYDFRRNPTDTEEQEENQLHPRIVSKGTIDSRQLASDLSDSSTYGEGEVKGMITALEDKIFHYLKEGYEVKLGDMGYFSLKLKSRPVNDPKKIRAYSISIDNVNFRTSSSFKKKLKGSKLVRAKNGFSQSKNISQDECRKRLMKYLEENLIITRRDYSIITGLLKNKALQSLESFIEEGIIEKEGRGTHVYYRKKKVVISRFTP